LALLPLALLPLALLPLALLPLALLPLLLLAALLLATTQRELEVEPGIVELGVLAQRLLVGLDRVLELALRHHELPRCSAPRRGSADPWRARLLEVLERALAQPALPLEILGRLGS